MKTAVSESTQRSTQSLEDAKAALREGFEQFLDNLSQPLIMEMVSSGAEEKYFDALQSSLTKTATKTLSPKVRNQIAYAKGKALSLEKIINAYELLDSKTVCDLLSVTRQALNKKIQLGQVIAYTDGNRKHYPAFQFENNAVVPEIGELIKALSIDPKDGAKVNVLLGFLAQEMDYSDPGEPENSKPRFEFLSDSSAFKIIVRDFKNRLSMGK